MIRTIGLFWVLIFSSNLAFAQQDDEDEYDFANATFSDTTKVKTYANPKIIGLSPQRFVSLGWDYQGPYTFESSQIGSFAKDENPEPFEKGRFNSTQGLRVGVMVPVISKTRFLWQMQANYWNINYNYTQGASTNQSSLLGAILNNTGLTNTNFINTFYLPLDDKKFILVQGQADLSGNYSFDKFQSLEFLRYSGAILWGKRPHDRKQWAIGISRTYRVGNMNYIPVVMYNYTSADKKWGTEILFPARAHYRRTFNARNMLLAGYELEGQSYRISDLSTSVRSFEIRRGELRARLDYQAQLYGFFWISLQAGVRYDWSFDADFLPDNQEFFRGFFGDQPFAMKNNLGLAPYFNVSINFVSP